MLFDIPVGTQQPVDTGEGHGRVELAELARGGADAHRAIGRGERERCFRQWFRLFDVRALRFDDLVFFFIKIVENNGNLEQLKDNLIQTVKQLL